jgi:hypothetical protein
MPTKEQNEDLKAIAKVREHLHYAWTAALEFPCLASDTGLSQTIDKAKDIAIAVEVALKHYEFGAEQTRAAKRLAREMTRKSK